MEDGNFTKGMIDKKLNIEENIFGSNQFKEIGFSRIENYREVGSYSFRGEPTICLIETLYEKSLKVEGMNVSPSTILISADYYLQLVAECAHHSGQVVFINEFNGLRIVIIPKQKEYLEIAVRDFEDFMRAYPDELAEHKIKD